jgi:predicted DNA-binding antitoxin AbrB/MazE fold protein
VVSGEQEGDSILHECSLEAQMKPVHAIYENGVFRPVERVELPEYCEVEFEPRIIDAADNNRPNLDDVYAVLGRRFDSGQSDVAEKHDEHQP